jgi:hypothetical protein
MLVVSALGSVIVVADREIISQAQVRRGPSASNPTSSENGVPSHASLERA